jgi:VanZ family protein
MKIEKMLKNIASTFGGKIMVRLAAVAVVLTICVLSLIPGHYRPHTAVPSQLEHVAAYVVAASALFLAFSDRLPLFRIVLLLTAYGALLELCQLGIPGRNFRVVDVAADFFGALLGVLMITFIERSIRKQWPQAAKPMLHHKKGSRPA